jgi:uncharacterized membrane protein YhaH (DUF805 family)
MTGRRPPLSPRAQWWAGVLTLGMCLAVVWSAMAVAVASLVAEGRATVGTYVLAAVAVAVMTAAMVRRYRKGNTP